MFYSTLPTPTLRIFCDFDGTICREDVGDAFFIQFGGESAKRDIEQCESGMVPMQQIFRHHEFRLRNTPVADMQGFPETYQVDPTFSEFSRWAALRKFSLFILSDGLDFYITKMLDEVEVHVKTFSNTAEFGVPSGLMIRSPFSDEDCSRCGCCKRNIMLTQSSEVDTIVYIGDGYSDQCPVHYADIVFARGKLEGYCQEQNISFRSFADFTDIRETLTGLLESKRIRKPHRAHLKRDAIWMSG